jgi:hypothetical protein
MRHRTDPRENIPMLHTIDEVKELQTKLADIQEDARDLVADLEGIARALRAAPGSEPAWLDELAADVRDTRAREDAKWLGTLGVAITTDDTRGFVFRG